VSGPRRGTGAIDSSLLITGVRRPEKPVCRQKELESRTRLWLGRYRGQNLGDDTVQGKKDPAGKGELLLSTRTIGGIENPDEKTLLEGENSKAHLTQVIYLSQYKI